MGQKVHPVGIRLGITKEWSSRWYANSQTFPDLRRAGSPHPRVPAQEAQGSVDQPHSHRAAGEEGQHHDPYGASGRRDRQEGRGHREAAQRSREAARDAAARRAAQHLRDPQARARRAARGRRHRAAARAPRAVPPRHAPRRDEHDAHRRRGHQGARVGPLERRRDRALGAVPRRPRAAAHVPRRHRLRVGRGTHDVRRDRRQGLGFPRRSARRRRGSRRRTRSRPKPRRPQQA